MIARIGIGAVALIIWLAVWLVGSPPAISIFWDRAEVTVVRHETREVHDGWSIVQRTDPIVEVASGSRKRGLIRLLVREAVGERDQAIGQWPVGLTAAARISPGGSIAYPASWRSPMLIPAVALTAFFALLAFIMFRPFFEKRWRAQGGPAIRRNAGSSFRPFAFGFGVIFTAVPLVLAYFFWNFGDPPPYSIAWPRLDMTVTASNVRLHQVGNGTTAAYVDVQATAPGSLGNRSEELQGITWGWIPIPEAEELRESRYVPGQAVRAMQSPDGTYYVVRWRFADFLALLIIPLGLVMVPVGLFAFRLAFS